MTGVIAWFRRERNRAYVYRGLLGSAPVFEAYGLVNDQKAALLLGAAAAWLGIGLAASNTSTKDPSA